MERKQAIYILENGLNIDGSWSKALNMAINSLKTDEAYQLMYEKVDFYTKDEVVDMLKKIVEDIANIDLPQRDPSYLDGFSEAQYQIQVDIQKKIYELRGETDGKDNN